MLYVVYCPYKPFTSRFYSSRNRRDMAYFDEKFAGKFAKKLMKILEVGKKPNKMGIKRAKRKFKWVNKLLKKDKVSLSEIARISKLEGEKLDKTIEELQKPIYGPLLWKVGSKFKVKKEVGETVIIRMHPDHEELSKKIADECRKLGVHAKVSNRTIDSIVRYYKYATAESCAEAPEPFITFSTESDVYIGSTLESDDWKKYVDSKKLKAGSPISMLHRERVMKHKQRGVIIGLPFKKIAKEFGVPYSKFRRVLFDSLWESFSPRIKKLVDFYAKKLSNKRIKITADDGTDLKLKCRKMKKDAGRFEPDDPDDIWMNLPTGEAFCAPFENQADGKIFFKKITPHGYGTIDNIWLTFKKGKLVNYKTSSKGMKIFKRMLDDNTGDKLRIGELGIGCNKKAEFLNGFILVDEKIFGTIHVAIGGNIMYGGKNESSLHFDMVKDMRNCNGKIWVGKKLVMDKGMPVGLRM
jgi:aminopeptidase